ncbi:unnamed protein product, partial [Staurois parvus]
QAGWLGSSGRVGSSGWIGSSGWVAYTGSIRLDNRRRDLRQQADRFGYWQDGTGWKEFSLLGFSYWSTVSKRRTVNGGSSFFFTGLKAG